MSSKSPVSSIRYADDSIQAYRSAHSLADVRGAISRSHKNLLYVRIATATENGQGAPVLFIAVDTSRGVLISSPDDPEPRFTLIEEGGRLMLTTEAEG